MGRKRWRPHDENAWDRNKCRRLAAGALYNIVSATLDNVAAAIICEEGTNDLRRGINVAGSTNRNQSHEGSWPVRRVSPSEARYSTT